MPILKRVVPAPKDIKDYRDESGVYFEAKCDQCGRIFYPKRGTAKYCSKTCSIEYRRGGILINPIEEKSKSSKPSETSNKKSIKPSTSALEKLKERNKKRRERFPIK
jgi:hypothetical protein